VKRRANIASKLIVMTFARRLPLELCLAHEVNTDLRVRSSQIKVSTTLMSGPERRKKAEQRWRPFVNKADPMRRDGDSLMKVTISILLTNLQ
jgi:hypothetical protein